MTQILVFFVALASVASLAEEPQSLAHPHYVRKIPIDYSHLPIHVPSNQDEEGEYMGRVFVLHSVLVSWKDGVGDQVTGILPWIDAEERIAEKWRYLVKHYNYRIVPFRSDRQADSAENSVNPRKHELSINLKEGVYLESDPALLLVGSICDADFWHRTQIFSADSATDAEEYRLAIDRFFESSRFKELKNNSEVRSLVAHTWMRRRTLQWQMAWYQKAVARNPMVMRPAFSRLVEQANEDPKAFRRTEIEALVSATSAQYRELIGELWDYRLPGWYDLPN